MGGGAHRVAPGLRVDSCHAWAPLSGRSVERVLRSAVGNDENLGRATDSSQPERAAFQVFCLSNRDWLDDYALFMACKRVHKDVAWVHWEAGIRDRDRAVLQEWRQRLSSSLWIA